MRILVLADEYPWPARTGYRQRLDAVVRALAAQHDVDLLCGVLDEVAVVAAPDDVALRRSELVRAPVRQEPRVRQLARWVVGRSPRSLRWRDWTALRSAVRSRLTEQEYDVVWLSHADTWHGVADLVKVPQIVDLDNLLSFMLRHRRDMTWDARSAGPRRAAVALLKAALFDLEGRRWQRLEQRIAAQVAVTVVCSTLDEDRLRVPSVKVMSNGYELTGSPAAELDPPSSREPILLFVGLLSYPPNIDAVLHFANNVLPLIRAEVPEAKLHIVGRHSDGPDIEALQALPGVVVTGEVAEVGPELARAAVSVVPIRYGGGTRIKILESFAHGVPVVTTTVGAEGLDAAPGRHLLLADGVTEFAAACVRLLQDPVLCSALSRAGRELWQERYRWTAIAPTAIAIVQEAGG